MQAGEDEAEFTKLATAHKAAFPEFKGNAQLDMKLKAMESAKTIKEKGMAWAQYFDGLGWKNKFGQQWGISSIPTMWLVDKKGMVVDTNGRADLETKVAKLLAE